MPRATPLDRVLAVAENVTLLEPGRWRARCELHGHRRNHGLRIGCDADGAVQVWCTAGCDVALILAALGLRVRDLR